MPDYRYKDRVALAYDSNKKRLRAEGQIILAALMNEALHEMTEEFNAALAENRLLEIGGTREEMKRFLAKAAERHLGVTPSKGSTRAIAGK
jgi:hypothetical protein